LFDKGHSLVNAPGSLYIDVFIRGNFTTDSNAMLVHFFLELADAERALNNQTGALFFEKYSKTISDAINRQLLAASGDHYITQRNPDGTIRDFVDYDSNLIALAHAVPTTKDQATRIMKRVDSGRCTHGRATFVSEKYYGPRDCVNGNVGDSWCSMARNAWFDAISRSVYGDLDTFDNVLLGPISADLRRWTWLWERYGCDGQPQLNRTWAYFEYPSVVSIMISRVRYGIIPGITYFTIKPFGVKQFNYHFGNTIVNFSQDEVSFSIPGSGTKQINIYSLYPNKNYQLVVSICGDFPVEKYVSDANGQITFSATISLNQKSCLCVLSVN